MFDKLIFIDSEYMQAPSLGLEQLVNDTFINCKYLSKLYGNISEYIAPPLEARLFMKRVSLIIM